MSLSPELLTAAGIGLVVVSLIIVLGVAVLRPTQSPTARRLREHIEPHTPTPTTLDSPDKSSGAALAAGTEALGAVMEKFGWASKLRRTLTAAGSQLSVGQFAAVMLAAACGGSLGLMVLSRFAIVAGVLGFGLGVIAPLLILRVRASRRQQQFFRDLPDVLTALASGLSSGLSLPQSLESVTRESNGPMREELGRAMFEVRLGAGIPDALEAMSTRTSCEDLGMVVMAIRMQAQHGGNLAELLNTVATTMRERVQMQRHVRALSAEGRLSMWVLMALPVVVLLALAVIRPDYFSFYTSTWVGTAALVAMGIWTFFGYLWARSIVKVQV